ncbi:hypothetical protein [Pseudomonas rhodesiae]|uniref:hypothetical protein n=1 Tax=Pseudomonas rhodesiae TaxID=76760 RepID=UPI0024E01491|nr:hypothetical protein [Pseudomonas rhodesiae]WHT75653.1 hypothetical protein QMY54_00388 [Pseudomonas rhodesiae]
MKPTYTWTNQALALLGTDTDRAVAAKLGITIGVVSSKRTRLNIKPSRSKGAPEHGALPAAPKAAPKEQSTPKVKFWTVDRIKLLGTKSDYELGRIWGVSNKRVTKKRAQLQISAFNTHARIEWTEDKIKMLGTMPDKTLAKLLGVSRSCVTLRRSELKIPALVTQQEVVWTEEGLRLLGTMSDKDVSSAIGISSSSVAYKRQQLQIGAFVGGRASSWTPERDAILGTMTDREAADQLGVTLQTVMLRRNALSIEAQTADSTTLGHSAHDHLDTRSMLTWTPDPRPLGQAVGAQRRRFALLV